MHDREPMTFGSKVELPSTQPSAGQHGSTISIQRCQNYCMLENRSLFPTQALTAYANITNDCKSCSPQGFG